MMFGRERNHGSNMWAILILFAALVFWYWASKEQQSAEEAAEDALNAAENVKKKVEINSAPEAEVKKETPTVPKAELEEEILMPDVQELAPVPSNPAPVPSASTEPDDLTRIEGIGPKYAEILVAAGIDSFAKLAQMSEDAIATTIQDGGGRKSASIATWAEQARLAAAGDWDGLDKLQASLRGGRK